MSTAHISERIAALSETHRECMTQIGRLSRTSGVGTEEARKELAGLIHHTLKDAESELEILSVEIGDLNAVLEPQAALQSKWNKLSEDIKLARVQYRKAQIMAKNESELARRKMLFGDSTDAGARRRTGRGGEGRKDLSADELVEGAANDVTLALRRTHDLMSAELNRSQFAAETLAMSTATIKNLSTTYSAFDSVLISSRAILTDLMRKNKSDQWYYQMSLYCLVSTIIWLVIRRFLWGPLWLLVYMPLRVLFRVLGFAVTTALSKDGADGGGGGEGTGVGEKGHGEGRKNEAESIASKILPKESIKGVDEAHRQDQAAKEPLTVTMDSGEVVKVRIDPVDVPPAAEDTAEQHEDTAPKGHDEL